MKNTGILIEVKDRNNKLWHFRTYESMILGIIHNEYGQVYVPDDVLNRMYELLFKVDYGPDREHQTAFQANCMAFAYLLGYDGREMKLYIT